MCVCSADDAFLHLNTHALLSPLTLACIIGGARHGGPQRGGGDLRLARASSTFLCRLKAEHVVLGWFLKEKKKEVADLTHMHGMSGLHIQNDNKIVYPLATVSPPPPLLHKRQ